MASFGNRYSRLLEGGIVVGAIFLIVLASGLTNELLMAGDPATDSSLTHVTMNVYDAGGDGIPGVDVWCGLPGAAVDVSTAAGGSRLIVPAEEYGVTNDTGYVFFVLSKSENLSGDAKRWNARMEHPRFGQVNLSFYIPADADSVVVGVGTTSGDINIQ